MLPVVWRTCGVPFFNGFQFDDQAIFDREVCLEIAQECHRVTQQMASQQLARGMAHEIKNPLGGVRGAAQLLERELPEKELKELFQGGDKLSIPKLN